MIASTLKWLLISAAFCFVTWVSAERPIPDLSHRVTDQTQTLSPDQQASLEQRLAAFEGRKGSQIALLMVASTAPEAIDQYALRVVEQWKLGRKNVDDGALLIVAKDDRQLRIEVGYGLEGALNDATCKRIIDEVIAPRFAQKDFIGGIEAGLDKMMRVVDGEPLPPPSTLAKAPPESALQKVMPQLIVVTVIIGLFLRIFMGLMWASLFTGMVVAVLAWWLLGTFATAAMAGFFAALVNLGVGSGLVTGGLHGGRNDRGGGGGGFGGGGGGFGGGGASGRW